MDTNSNNDQPMEHDNNNDDDAMEEELRNDGTSAVAQDNDDDELDQAPVFVTADDAVEVATDDKDVPMDDDDDDDEGKDGPQEENAAITDSIPDQSVQQYTTHTGPVYALSAGWITVNSDQTMPPKLVIVSGGGDDRACLSTTAGPNNNNGTSSVVLDHAHTDSVAATALNWSSTTTTPPSPPSQYLAAVGAYDGAIVLYDALTGTRLHQLEGPTDVEWLSFHPTGTVLLAGSAADGTVWMYHVPLATATTTTPTTSQPPRCLHVFVGHESSVTAGVFTTDGKLAVTASSDGTVRVWAPKTGACKHVIRVSTTDPTQDSDNGGSGGITCLATHPLNPKLVVVGTDDGQAHVVHVGSGQVVQSVRHTEDGTSVEAVGFNATATFLATAGVDGRLKIWTVSTGQGRHTVTLDTANNTDTATPLPPPPVTRLHWHDHLLITASTCVSLVDARSGQVLSRQMAGSDAVLNDMHVLVATENDGSSTSTAHVVTASDDHVVRVFAIALPSA